MITLEVLRVNAADGLVLQTAETVAFKGAAVIAGDDDDLYEH